MLTIEFFLSTQEFEIPVRVRVGPESEPWRGRIGRENGDNGFIRDRGTRRRSQEFGRRKR